MKNNLIESIICPDCRKQLSLQIKYQQDCGILTCGCSEYPMLLGIIYLRDKGLGLKSSKLLVQGKLIAAIAVVCQERRLTWFPLWLFLNLQKFLWKIDGNLYKLRKFVPFNLFVELLTIFRYPKPWAWYLVNRTRIPSFLMSVYITEVFGNKSDKFLDIGCGTGHLMLHLARKVKPENTCGIDESFLSLLLARIFFADRNQLLVCQKLERTIPFFDNTFDFVSATDTLHYFNRKEYMLKEISRISNQLAKLGIIHTVTYKDPKYNLNGISQLKMSKLLKQVGYKDVHIWSNSKLWGEMHQKQVYNDPKQPYEIDRKTYAFSLIAGKKLLKPVIKLSGSTQKLMVHTKVEYDHDPELKPLSSLDRVIDDYSRYYFISPHLDDAVLSCSTLIKKLKSHSKDVTVISVFTDVDSPPYTQTAAELLNLCGYVNADKFFMDRRHEDHEALRHLKCNFVHLGYTDAAWRKTVLFNKVKKLRPVLSSLSFLTHIYPTPGKQFSGSYSLQDYYLVNNILKKLDELIPAEPETLILGPLGIGGHADHVLVNTVLKKMHMDTLYWEDYPYNYQLSEGKINVKSIYTPLFILKAKTQDLLFYIYKFYRTYINQWLRLFPSDFPIDKNERYYLLENKK